MRVSILIPTIDRPDYFRESLASACSQTHTDLEILVSDDSPARRNAAHALAIARTDARVKVLRPNPRPGLYENYNYLIQHATGDAFGILDDDDRWLPDMIETLARPLRSRPSIVATFCDHWVVSTEGTRLPADTNETSAYFGRAWLPSGIVRDAIPLAMRGGLSTVFALFRRSVFQQELFDEACAGAADLDYGIRAALKGDIYYVRDRLGEYRAHSRRTTATQTAWLFNGVVSTLQKHSFREAKHEEQRRLLLVAGYRRQIVYYCTRDRRAWLKSLAQYLKAEGRPVDSGLILSLVLMVLPHALGENFRLLLKTVREWTDPATSDLPRTRGGILTRVEGAYRAVRRSVAAAMEAPVNRWRYGHGARYLTRARHIPGWTTTDEAAALMRAVGGLREDAVIVEVGSFLGKSAVVLAGACRLKGGGRVHCVDPFDGSGDAFSVQYYRGIAAQSGRSLRQRFDRNIDGAGLANYVAVHQATAERAASVWTLPIDMLYLDGDQSPAGARRAYESFAPFLNAGAIVALHNASDRPYHDGHDGNRRLAVEVLTAPNYTRVVSVGSIVLAEFAPDRCAPALETAAAPALPAEDRAITDLISR